jgi:hypothetical protein
VALYKIDDEMKMGCKECRESSFQVQKGPKDTVKHKVPSMVIH